MSQIEIISSSHFEQMGSTLARPFNSHSFSGVSGRLWPVFQKKFENYI